eukprot:5574034-Amphidinium_carterae.1
MASWLQRRWALYFSENITVDKEDLRLEPLATELGQGPAPPAPVNARAVGQVLYISLVLISCLPEPQTCRDSVDHKRNKCIRNPPTNRDRVVYPHPDFPHHATKPDKIPHWAIISAKLRFALPEFSTFKYIKMFLNTVLANHFVCRDL